MNKREFLKTTGLLGLASMAPIAKVLGGVAGAANSNTCVSIPTETAGPFPLDLTANTFYFRQDIRENKTGVQLNLRLRIIGDSNCLPMQNLRVNIWHCDSTGLYSGYSQTNNPGQAGLTYLRGYQYTDVNGEVEFITIFPGWYSGRVCHIHFQVYVNSNYAAISQLTFDVATKNAIYAANSAIYTNGADPMALANDNVFSNGYAYQMATLTPNTATGGYDSFLEATIQGTGTTTGLGHIENINAGQFHLGQNFPNPYGDFTTIPVSLKFPSDITLDIYDLNGRKLRSIVREGLSSGDHLVEVIPSQLGLAVANYAYQLEVRNINGVFREAKMMTAKK
ncbi:MAG: hypothetical protein U0Y08_08250 [Bacteroidia bacterium]